MGSTIAAVAFLAGSLHLGRGPWFVLHRWLGVSQGQTMLFGVGLVALSVALDYRAALWRNRWRMLKVSGLVAFECVFVGVLLLLTLKVFDRYVGWRQSQTGVVRSEFEQIQGRPTARTLELFPYDGWHIQANYHHQGPMPWEGLTYAEKATNVFDVQTGAMGFFIDFDLDHPPDKAANEFRIVLIGGSGAQGWGGTTNDRMMYSQLNRILNERLAHRGVFIRVINMAMGSSVSYQNFIALNRWGHALEPDLILSYSGRNDFVVPLLNLPTADTHYVFRELDAMAIAARPYEVPKSCERLNAWFPNILNRTTGGRALKLASGFDDYLHKAEESYSRSRGLACRSAQEALDQVVIPLHVHSLQSIKRDFRGIPILLAWQAVHGVELVDYERKLGTDFYNRTYTEVRRQLEGYENDRWYFVNIHQLVENRRDGRFGTHLDDAAHKIVATLLAEHLEPHVWRLYRERQAE